MPLTMPQRQPQSPNQTVISITNDTESSSSVIPNDTKNKGSTGDNSPGIEALCGIYFTYAVIISVGILGNAILIKVFFKTKSMQTVPNIFITSLAFGDLLLLLTCVPVDATHYLAEGWLFGRIGCKVLSFIQLTSVGVSVFTLTILSADRWVSFFNYVCQDVKLAKKKEKLVFSIHWLLLCFPHTQ